MVFEGGDRCGKTTQVNLLGNALQALGFPVQIFKFPDRTTPTGHVIHQYLTRTIDLDDKEVHLLFSKNRWECHDRMRSLLEKGTYIIADRYAFSGVAFTAAKGLDVTWCQQPDAGLIAPDVVFYLDAASSDVAHREGFGQERYETSSMQTQVRKIFLTHLFDPTTWVSIHAIQPKESVHQQIMDLVRDRVIPMAQQGVPLNPLWPELIKQSKPEST